MPLGHRDVQGHLDTTEVGLPKDPPTPIHAPLPGGDRASIVTNRMSPLLMQQKDAANLLALYMRQQRKAAIK